MGSTEVEGFFDDVMAIVDWWNPGCTAQGREGSQLSVLFYLNDGFIGGATTFIDYEVSIEPKRGSVLLFEHAMLHEGCAATEGTKYVLRTDVMYRFTPGTEME